MTLASRKAMLALLPAALALTAPAFVSSPALAQAAPKKPNMMQRHPKATGVAAGLAAHHMAKKGAKGKMAQGKKPNMMQRHPKATGVAAGLAAHHMAKKK